MTPVILIHSPTIVFAYYSLTIGLFFMTLIYYSLYSLTIGLAFTTLILVLVKSRHRSVFMT
jgi:hypothetical protein